MSKNIVSDRETSRPTADVTSPELRARSAAAAFGPAAYPASWIVLFIAWLSYVVDMFMRYNIPTAIPILRHEYGWSATTVGWVDSAYLWAYALSQIPWAWLCEKKLGGRRTLACGTAMMVVASIVFALHSESVTLAIIARFFIGAGSGAFGAALNPVLARWFAPRIRGLQVGLWATGAPIGTGIGGALMPILIGGSVLVFGLTAIQSGFLLSAIPGVIALVLVLLFMRNRPEDIGLRSLDTPPQAAAQAADEPGFLYIMRHSIQPYLLGFVYAGFIGTKYFMWTWFAAFLASRYHVNPRSAGFIWAFVAAVPPVVMQPLAGLVSDRFGRVRSIVVALIINAILVGCFVWLSASGNTSMPLWGVMTLAGLFSIFANMWVMVWPLTTIMFPTSAGGPIGGYMNSFTQLVGAIAPVISGYFIDVSGSYTPAFACGMACALIGALCALGMKERRVV